MLKTIAIIFGLIMTIVGVLGFIPEALVEDRLFGIFRVDLIHNLIHIVTGVAALLCGFATEHTSRVFFQIFGIIYALVALAGFYYQNHPLFDLIAHNVADTWLHVVIAALSLFLGFFYHRRIDLPMDHHR